MKNSYTKKKERRNDSHRIYRVDGNSIRDVDRFGRFDANTVDCLMISAVRDDSTQLLSMCGKHKRVSVLYTSN